MFLHEFEKLCAIGESMEVKLPRRGLKLDPRVNRTALFYPLIQIRFDCEYHGDGITVTLTRVRIHDNNDHKICIDTTHTQRPFTMRVFDPETEVVPDFTSTTYVYFGLKGEMPPLETREIVIHPSTKIIRRHAFSSCHRLERCTMHDQVEIIEERAFARCASLDALFLPSSIQKIEKGAFSGCTSMRILSLSTTAGRTPIEMEQKILQGCHTFFHRNKAEIQSQVDSNRGEKSVSSLRRRYFSFALISRNVNNKKKEASVDKISNANILHDYHRYRNGTTDNHDQATVHQAIVDFHLNLPPLHKVCMDTNVSAQTIYECITNYGTRAALDTAYGGMTPMQILVLNPHTTTGAIIELLHSNMSAVFERYSSGRHRGDNDDDDDNGTYESPLDDKTPMDYMLRYDVDSHISVIRVLCIYRTTTSS